MKRNISWLTTVIKIIRITDAFVVSDWQDIPGNYALIYMPFISYLPNDNTEISFGIRLIGGEGDDVFAKYKDKDEFVLAVKFMF